MRSDEFRPQIHRDLIYLILQILSSGGKLKLHSQMTRSDEITRAVGWYYVGVCVGAKRASGQKVCLGKHLLKFGLKQNREISCWLSGTNEQLEEQWCSTD